MRKLRKKFRRPKTAWSREQIGEQSKARHAYGLRSNRELLASRETLRSFRQQARNLIAKPDEKRQDILMGKLARLGMLKEGAGLDDVLALTVESVLDRRLQTVLLRKGMAQSMGHARQLITHGWVAVAGRRTKYPSFMVSADDEVKIGWYNGEPPEMPKAKSKGVKAVEKEVEDAGEEPGNGKEGKEGEAKQEGG